MALTPDNTEILRPYPINGIVIDGQDGSGKGTVAGIITDQLLAQGHNVIPIAYPVYELPWGSFLSHLLREDDEGLTVEEKMLVYALNRTESVRAVQKAQQQGAGKPTDMVFDRFFTSNALTAAYYAAQYPEQLSVTPESIASLYAYMLTIDNDFLDHIGLHDWNAWIPLVHEDEIMRRLQGDNTRSGLDKHERVDVQQLAADIYRRIAQLDRRVHTFEQYSPTEGRNLFPTEVAQRIMMGSVAHGNYNEISGSGTIITPQLTREAVDTDLVNSLLDQFGTDRLHQFNPYKSTE
ncbi:MAG: hypothetical protein NUV52_03435 [Candidatus Roizmanbacteria bacterium]|nr:hypothetical protein [Candidatus Roizmanbacteria bacterium]